MKRILFAMVASASVMLSMAQERIIKATNITENWYGGGLIGTAYSPVLKGMRPAFGLEIGKQFTPIVGISVQAITGINTTTSKCAFDELGFTLNGKLNFMNLFGGYKGSPRFFEIEGVMGMGVHHNFYKATVSSDDDKFTARLGGSFNFNLGKEKQLTLSVRPAYLPIIDGDGASTFAINSRFELMAGVVYHFKGRSGNRHHTTMTAYSQEYVDRMNDDINAMRKRAEEAERKNKEAAVENKDLRNALDNCNKQAKAIEEKSMNMTIEPVVSFRQGKDKIEASQLSNIESIANYIKENKDVKIDIKGYASPEGNANFNQKLSERRAFTIKEILVNKYNVDANRITAKGMGVGNRFSKPEMNRAIVVTFYK